MGRSIQSTRFPLKKRCAVLCQVKGCMLFWPSEDSFKHTHESCVCNQWLLLAYAIHMTIVFLIDCLCRCVLDGELLVWDVEDCGFRARTKALNHDAGRYKFLILYIKATYYNGLYFSSGIDVLPSCCHHHSLLVLHSRTL